MPAVLGRKTRGIERLEAEVLDEQDVHGEQRAQLGS
jgi:hypothetical protein